MPNRKFRITPKGKWNLDLIFPRYILAINSIFPQRTDAESMLWDERRAKNESDYSL